MIPSGAASKLYKGGNRINSSTENSPLKLVAMKAMNKMSRLLFLKPSKRSKTKDQISALDRWLRLWEEKKFGNPFWEVTTFRNGLNIIFNS